MKNKEEKLIQLDSELDKIFDELKEVFKKLVFKSMVYRDLSMDIVSDKLQESFDKMLSPSIASLTPSNGIVCHQYIPL